MESTPVEIWDKIAYSASLDEATATQTLGALAQTSRFFHQTCYKYLLLSIDLKPQTPPKPLHKNIPFINARNDLSMQRLDAVLNISNRHLQVTRTFRLWGRHFGENGWETNPTIVRFITELPRFVNLRKLILAYVSIAHKELATIANLITTGDCPLELFALEDSYYWGEDRGDIAEYKEENAITSTKGSSLRKVRWVRNRADIPVPWLLHKIFPPTLTSITIDEVDEPETDTTIAVLCGYEFPVLQTFKSVSSYSGQLFWNMVGHRTNLERLKLLRCDELDNVNFDPQALPNLRMLRGSYQVIQALVPGRPVEAIQYCGLSVPWKEFKSTFGLSKAQITEFSIRNHRKTVVNPYFKLTGLGEFAEMFPGLQVLGIPVLFKYLDGLVADLAKLPRLHTLTLTVAMYIKKPTWQRREHFNSFLKALLERCPQVKKVIWYGLCTIEYHTHPQGWKLVTEEFGEVSDGEVEADLDQDGEDEDEDDFW